MVILLGSPRAWDLQKKFNHANCVLGIPCGNQPKHPWSFISAEAILLSHTHVHVCSLTNMTSTALQLHNNQLAPQSFSVGVCVLPSFILGRTYPGKGSYSKMWSMGSNSRTFTIWTRLYLMQTDLPWLLESL